MGATEVYGIQEGRRGTQEVGEWNFGEECGLAEALGMQEEAELSRVGQEML